MYVFFSVLIVIASLLLIFFVVIQNSKGGGLAAGFSSSNQVMGVRKTTDFLEKATWALAAVVVVLAIVVSLLLPGRNSKGAESEIKSNIENAVPAVDPNAVSPFETPIPEGSELIPVQEAPAQVPVTEQETPQE